MEKIRRQRSKKGSKAALQKKKAPLSEFEQKKLNMRRQRRKMRAKRRITVFLFLFLCAGVVTVVLKAPMFNIKSVMCAGAETISDEELIRAAGVKTGSNIFSANVGMMKKRVSELPQVSESNVRRIFPNKIKIWVRESKPAAFMRNDAAAFVIDRNGKIIRQTKRDAEELSQIAELTGLELTGTKPGAKITDSDDLRAEKIFECLGIMSDLDMIGKTQYIDASDLSDIKIGYENRLRILIGGYEKMDYKLRFIKKVIDEKLSPYESANLDYTGEKLYVGPIENETEQSGQTDTENTENTENTGAADGENKSAENGAAQEDKENNSGKKEQ